MSANPRDSHAGSSANDGMDRPIGSIISDARNLSAEQVEQVVRHQRTHGVRFGEAAIALGFASTDDVLFALAQQFHYPYAAEEQRGVSPELVTLNQPFTAQAEAFRALRSQLMMRTFSDTQSDRKALAVISPEKGDGRSYVTANLAATLAQLGGRTLLVDADMRSPRQHQIFGLKCDSGLSGILSGRSESQVIQQAPGVRSLFILPVGVVPPNPVELVERPAFGLLMRELVSKFDHVIVDTPAAESGSDAQVIAARCGAAIIVAHKHAARVSSTKALIESLAFGATQLNGVVLNEH